DLVEHDEQWIRREARSQMRFGGVRPVRENDDALRRLRVRDRLEQFLSHGSTAFRNPRQLSDRLFSTFLPQQLFGNDRRFDLQIRALRLLTQAQSLDKDQFVDLTVANSTRLAEQGIVAARDRVNHEKSCESCLITMPGRPRPRWA